MPDEDPKNHLKIAKCVDEKRTHPGFYIFTFEIKRR